jgi:hypothetical protein
VLEVCDSDSVPVLGRITLATPYGNPGCLPLSDPPKCRKLGLPQLIHEKGNVVIWHKGASQAPRNCVSVLLIQLRPKFWGLCVYCLFSMHFFALHLPHWFMQGADAPLGLAILDLLRLLLQLHTSPSSPQTSLKPLYKHSELTLLQLFSLLQCSNRSSLVLQLVHFPLLPP